MAPIACDSCTRRNDGLSASGVELTRNCQQRHGFFLCHAYWNVESTKGFSTGYSTRSLKLTTDLYLSAKCTVYELIM
jgi:hypothetical protein